MHPTRRNRSRPGCEPRCDCSWFAGGDQNSEPARLEGVAADVNLGFSATPVRLCRKPRHLAPGAGVSICWRDLFQLPPERADCSPKLSRWQLVLHPLIWPCGVAKVQSAMRPYSVNWGGAYTFFIVDCSWLSGELPVVGAREASSKPPVRGLTFYSSSTSIRGYQSSIVCHLRRVCHTVVGVYHHLGALSSSDPRPMPQSSQDS